MHLGVWCDFAFFTLLVNFVTPIYSSKFKTLNETLNKLCCGGNDFALLSCGMVGSESG